MRNLCRLATALCLSAHFAGAASAQPVTNARPEFFAVDVFGGWVDFGGERSDGESSGTPPRLGKGWSAGATWRWQPRIGVRTEVAQTLGDTGRSWQYLGGISLNSSYDMGQSDPGGGVYRPGTGLRGFAHALAGYVRDSTGDGGGNGGAEVMAGAGFDWLFFRLEADYVRVGLDSRPKNGSRVFVGGVLPLCFRSCSQNDGDGLIVGTADGYRNSAGSP